MNVHMFPKITGTYDITACSANQKLHPMLTCVFCQKRIKPALATAGPLFADNHQAFACSEHLWNRSQWLREWAKFEIRQRRVRKLAALIERSVGGC